MTLASLAGSCVPVLADECVINVVDDTGAAFQLRRPLPSGSGEPSDVGPDRVREAASAAPNDGDSVTVVVREEECGDEPGYTADITFRWTRQDASAGVDDRDRVIAELLTERTTHLIRQERLGAALLRETDRSRNLTKALTSNRHIGQALGILMSTYKLTSEQAFDLLRSASQHTNRKLRDIADDVNLTGTLTVATFSSAEATSTPAVPSSLHVADGPSGLLSSTGGAHPAGTSASTTRPCRTKDNSP